MVKSLPLPPPKIIRDAERLGDRPSTQA